MSKHTKEPWTFDHRKPSHPFYLTGQRELSCNDYERAVQCVNACAGMDDPESEIQSLRDRVKELEGKLKDYEALHIHNVAGQRKLLLAFKKWEAEKCKLPWDTNPEQIVEQYLSQ